MTGVAGNRLTESQHALNALLPPPALQLHMRLLIQVKVLLLKHLLFNIVSPQLGALLHGLEFRVAHCHLGLSILLKGVLG